MDRAASHTGLLWACGLALACGRTTGATDASGAARSALECGDVDDVEIASLKPFAKNTEGAAFGPCGELSYRTDEQTFLTDPSLQQAEVVKDASSALRFDPRGRGYAFLKSGSEDDQLIYRDPRGGSAWSRTLPLSVTGSPPRFDFYESDSQGHAFACQNRALYGNDGQAPWQYDVDMNCDLVMYSGRDALLWGFTQDGMSRVSLASGKLEPLSELGICQAEDHCDWRLVNLVLEQEEFGLQVMGDVVGPVSSGVKYYSATTGEAVSGVPLTTPERRVVSASGLPAYLAEDRSLAVTRDVDHSYHSTRLSYYGPDPRHPERWLEATVPLASSSVVYALPSAGGEQVALWSDSCNFISQPLQQLAARYTPGGAIEPLPLTGCLRNVYWVGTDGTMLAGVAFEAPTSPYDSVVIHPDRSITRLDLPQVPINELVCNGRVAIATLGENPAQLVSIDLATGQTTVLASHGANLHTDQQRRRLFLLVRLEGVPSEFELWAGAFPSPL